MSLYRNNRKKHKRLVACFKKGEVAGTRVANEPMMFKKKMPSWRKQMCIAALLAILAPLVPFGVAAAATDTKLSGDDVYAGPFPIGFEFEYFGKKFTQFYATTNGLMQFENPTTAYSNTTLPKFTNTFYVFWDDLRTNVAGQPEGVIQFETQGDAPNRRFILQWTNQYFYGTNLPMGTFQVVLNEGSNEIAYQYRDLLDERSFGNSATVGIQGNEQQFYQVGYNQSNLLAPERAISFKPSADGMSYQVNTNAEFNFYDISGLSPNRPQPVSRYVNESLEWTWDKVPSLTTYEVKVFEQAGGVIYNDVIGDASRFSYSTGLAHGQTYRSRVRGSINHGGTWEAWSSLSTPITVDTVKPQASLTAFSHAGSNTAKIAYAVSDDLSGVEKVELQIATDAAFTNIVFDAAIPSTANQYSVSNLPASENLYARLNVVDKAGNTSGYTQALSIGLGTPVFTAPVGGVSLYKPEVNVAGSAGAGDEVQLYLNGIATGKLIKVDALGKFSTTLTLPAEGRYTLTAKAQNAQGSSELSSGVTFTYEIAVPTVAFTAPQAGATLTGTTTIAVNATDKTGVKRVEIFVGNKRLADLNQPPYQVNWDASTVANGEHTIKVVVTNSNGKTVTETRVVNVQVDEEGGNTSTAPQTSYFGELQAITPDVSYGGDSIAISGRAIDRTTGQAVSNTPLQIVLSVKGFDRRINIVTNAQGVFNYTFVPQANDSGTYSVTVAHPKEDKADVKVEAQGSFTINRIKFSASKYALTAAHGIPTQITVNATAESGAQGLRWVLRNANQSGSALPQGIEVQTGQGINVVAGKTVPMVITFTGSSAAQQSGVIQLVVLAEDSGDTIRGELDVHYNLVAPTPGLYIGSSRIQTGVRQGDTVTESVELTNKGLAAAQNVRVQLVDANGKTPPEWIFLASASQVGVLDASGSTTLQVTAQPSESVTNGIYNFKLRVSADNAAGGEIPVSVAITQSTQGHIEFKVEDIFTATLDADGNPIAGVQGATIKLQNEAVLTELYTFKTNNEGVALFEDLPTGIYLFRVSAPNHMDKSGRIKILPSITGNQYIFLDYETVSIEFDVTETTVDDVYDIEVEATFETNVPTPVVLLEPMSINLAGLQVGEEKTGQFTLTNYGLVQADNVRLTLPQTDEQFQYDFFADIPSELPPKTRLVIPYRVVALAGVDGSGNSSGSGGSLGTGSSGGSQGGDGGSQGGGNNGSGGLPGLGVVAACKGYTKEIYVQYSSVCANGQETNGSGRGSFYLVTGTNCSGGGVIWGGGSCGGGGGGGWGGSVGTPSPMPMAPDCTPPCPTGLCGQGHKAGDQ